MLEELMMNRRWVALIGLFAASFMPPSLYAVIHDGENIEIKLARGRVPDGLTFSPGMELLDGALAYQPKGDAWIKSQPIPIGFEWALPTSVRVSLCVERSYVVIDRVRVPENEDYISCYVRYGVDKTHWSSWIPVPKKEARSEYGPEFSTSVTIPRYEWKRWPTLWAEWAKTDKSQDMSRFFNWTEKRHPDYLDREIPFIGYVEVLVEWPGYSLGKLEVSGIKVGLGWALGGAAGNRRSEDGKPVEGAFQGAKPPRWTYRRMRSASDDKPEATDAATKEKAEPARNRTPADGEDAAGEP
jgi:hypothetical protein